MTRTVIIVAAVGAAIAGYLYWASDERQIRRLLDGVAGLAEVTSLTRYLAPDVAFEPGEPFRPVTGAQDVVSTVGRVRAVMTTVELTFADVQIAVDGSTASVRTTARLTLKDRNGDQSVETRDALIALAERETGWVITTARAQARP